jgi:hypothetical protein
MSFGAEAPVPFLDLYAALKRRSSTFSLHINGAALRGQPGAAVPTFFLLLLPLRGWLLHFEGEDYCADSVGVIVAGHEADVVGAGGEF